MMKPMRECAGSPARWTQPEMMRQQFVLTHGAQPAARLSWEKMLGSLARGETAEGEWTFKRQGFLRPSVTIRRAGAAEDLAVFYPGWSGDGSVVIEGRPAIRWAASGFWRTHWTFRVSENVPLVHYRPTAGLLRLSGDMEIEAGAESLPELPWLCLLGWYLLVLYSQETAA